MEFTIRTATAAQAPDIYRLLQEIGAQINDRNLFISGTADYIQAHIEAEGFTLLAMYGKTIAGFFVFETNRQKAEAYMQDLGWPLANAALCAVADTVCVAPAYRGHGLHRRLLLEGETLLRALGFSSMVTTVSPQNTASLRNFYMAGYTLGVTKPKHGGVLRHVLYKTL